MTDNYEITTNKDLALTGEIEAMEEMGRRLDTAQRIYEGIDRAIARGYHLPRRGGRLKRYLTKLFNGAVDETFVSLLPRKGKISPLALLEYGLKLGMNQTKDALGQVISKVRQEKTRIRGLYQTLEKAEKEGWNPSQFLNYIEANTDFDFIITSDGRQEDIKQFQASLEKNLNPAQLKAQRKDFFNWFRGHIKTSENYYNMMIEVGKVSIIWIQKMSMSYFDVLHLRDKPEILESILKKTKDGAMKSYCTEGAIQAYGHAILESARALVQGYHKLEDARKSRNPEQLRLATEDLGREIDNILLGTKQEKSLEYKVEEDEDLLEPLQPKSLEVKTKVEVQQN